MLGKLKCRFIIAYDIYRVGDIIFPPGTFRQWLLENGYIEIVKDDPPAVPVETPRMKGRKRAS